MCHLLKHSTLSWKSLYSAFLTIVSYPTSPCSWQCFSFWISCFQTLPFNSYSSLLPFCAKLPNHLYILLFTFFPPYVLSDCLTVEYGFQKASSLPSAFPTCSLGGLSETLITSCSPPVLPHSPLENVLQWWSLQSLTWHSWPYPVSSIYYPIPVWPKHSTFFSAYLSLFCPVSAS